MQEEKQEGPPVETEYDSLKLAVAVKNNGQVVVDIKGRLETANSNSFLNYMAEVIDDAAIGCELVLSMGDLYYVSSTGIGAFTTILVNSKKKNIQLFIKDMQPKVKSVLELLGFTSFFNFR